MSGLGGFLPQEQDLLIGIYYRVGFWISHVDDTDVEDASEALEQKQLLTALNKIAASKATTDMVREIAAEAVRRSGDQSRWLSLEEKLLHDVARTAKLVHAQGTQEDFSSFRKSLMFVATSVARAYREEPDHVEQESAFGRLLEKASQMITAVSDKDAYKDMNISPAEDTALHELAEALRVAD